MRTRFPELVQFKAPDGFLSAVETAAHANTHRSPNSFAGACLRACRPLMLYVVMLKASSRLVPQNSIFGTKR
jgi:hypothetical protein